MKSKALLILTVAAGAGACGESTPNTGFQPTPASGTGTSSGAGGGSTGATGSGGASGSGSSSVASTTGASGGVGGVTSAGGTGGSGTGGGAVSAGGSGGSGGSTVYTPEPSAGCGVAATQALEQYVRYTFTPSEVAAACNLSPEAACEAAANLNVAQDGEGNARTEREYFVRLPTGYDPNKPYRLIHVAMGCFDQTETKAYPMHEVDSGEAIYVTMQYVGTPADPCFDDMIPDSPDFPLVEAIQQRLDETVCFDRKRVFFGGYSSGSWLANSVACLFGGDAGFIRGIGAYTGGLNPFVGGGTFPCQPGPTAGIFVHDRLDMENVPAGGLAACGLRLQSNACAEPGVVCDVPGDDPTAMIAPGDPYVIEGLAQGAPQHECKLISGCSPENPVVWCWTSDVEHSDSADALIIPTFWQFFSGL